MLTLLSWIFFGLIVGVIAKFLMPGRDPGGFFVTMGIGIAGAFIGGFLARLIGLYDQQQQAGFLTSIGGAILLLWLYRQFSSRNDNVVVGMVNKEKIGLLGFVLGFFASYIFAPPIPFFGIKPPIGDYYRLLFSYMFSPQTQDILDRQYAQTISITAIICAVVGFFLAKGVGAMIKAKETKV